MTSMGEYSQRLFLKFNLEWGMGIEPTNLYGKGLKPFAFGHSATPTWSEGRDLNP